MFLSNCLWAFCSACWTTLINDIREIEDRKSSTDVVRATQKTGQPFQRFMRKINLWFFYFQQRVCCLWVCVKVRERVCVRENVWVVCVRVWESVYVWERERERERERVCVCEHKKCEFLMKGLIKILVISFSWNFDGNLGFLWIKG